MLSSLYEAINAQLDVIHAYARLVWDEDAIAVHEPPPRMIVIPSDDQFDSPKHAASNPRALATVWEGANLIIQGETKDHCQGMRDQFVIALHVALKLSGADTAYAGQYRLGGGQWTRKQYLAVNGFEYTLRFASLVAIVKRRWDDVTPPQAPTASTYANVLSYPIIPVGQGKANFNVGFTDDPTNPTVVVPKAT